ncbi:MAG TPA: branched-chain amino acid ABC transporter permease [Candidatus Magasanikbacteria bacterium]|nr:branched-chain amino acid ABC transporter permease [Candidatus Magasanikbacteria bacterium]
MFAQILTNSLIAGSVYAIMAISFSLVYSSTKFFNMAHGMIAVVGGYLVLTLTKLLGLGAIPSIILGIISTGLCGVIIHFIVFEPLKKRQSSSTTLLVASLGVMIIIQAIISILFTSQFKTLGANYNLGNIYTIASATFTEINLVTIISALSIFAFLIIIFKYTRFGKIVRALNDSEEVATIVGIDTKKTIRYLIFIGSAIAGVAGILTGYDTGLEPTMGMRLLLKGIVATIIGGTNSLGGALIGAYFLASVENFGIWKLSGEWKDAIALGLLIIFLVFRPRGIIRK